MGKWVEDNEDKRNFYDFRYKKIIFKVRYFCIVESLRIVKYPSDTNFTLYYYKFVGLRNINESLTFENPFKYIFKFLSKFNKSITYHSDNDIINSKFSKLEFIQKHFIRLIRIKKMEELGL